VRQRPRTTATRIPGKHQHEKKKMFVFVNFIKLGFNRSERGILCSRNSKCYICFKYRWVCQVFVDKGLRPLFVV
jgi:hypothetical protein